MIELDQIRLKEMFSVGTRKESGGVDEIEQVHIMLMEKIQQNETEGVHSVCVSLKGNLNRVMISDFEICCPENSETLLEHYKHKFPNIKTIFKFNEKNQTMSESDFLSICEKKNQVITKIKSWSVYDFSTFKQMIMNYNAPRFHIIIDTELDNTLFRFDNYTNEQNISIIKKSDSLFTKQSDVYEANIKIAKQAQNDCDSEDET